MTDTDYLAELQEAHRMNAAGQSKEEIRQMLRKAGADPNVTTRITTLATTPPISEGAALADWLDPFIDALAPQEEIKEATGVAKVVLTKYRNAAQKAVKARNGRERQLATRALEQAHHALAQHTVKSFPHPNSPGLTVHQLSDYGTLTLTSLSEPERHQAPSQLQPTHRQPEHGQRPRTPAHGPHTNGRQPRHAGNKPRRRNPTEVSFLGRDNSR